MMTDDEIPGAEVKAPRPSPRVLIVDDEESIRRLVSKWIDISGYDVKAASSAEAALLMMHAWTADIVVCDIRMPGYSGVWLIEHLRSLYPSAAIIISTGYGEVDSALRRRANIAGYLSKPYDRETLTAALDRALEARGLLLLYPISPLLKHGEQSLRTDNMGRANDDKTW